MQKDNIEKKKGVSEMNNNVKYLNPKADLTLKLVFGEHADLMMSLLNALLPLKPDEQITHVEYITPEMVPENPAKKNSVVDVRCYEKKMAVLWLRFLTEISEQTEEAPAELLENAEISKALSIVEKSAFNDKQLYAYEQFWDAVYVEKALIEGGYDKGRAEAILETARKMKAKNYKAEDIAEITGLPISEIERL